VKTPVYDVIVVNDTIWAATKNGIAFANINNYLPISSNWSNFTTANSVLKKNQVNAAAFFNGNIFFGTDSGFVFYSGGTLNIFEPSYNGTPIRDKIYRIAVSGNILYFLTAIQSNNIYSVNTSNLTQANLVYQNANANSILITSSGELLIGTGDRGVNIFRNNTDNYVMPNGPLSNTAIFAETDAQKNVWFVSGGTNEGISKFDGKTWKGYSVQQYPWMQGNDFRQIYASDYNGKVYASGYGPGMLQIDGDSLLLFTDQNSCIRPFTPGFTLVEGIKEDNSGNLWIVNRAADNGKPILNFSSCQSYYVPENQSATTLIFLAIDNYGTKWMTFPNDLPSGERGICYYNESANAGGIIRAVELGSDINNANNIIVENNGEVWIGTDNGVVIIPDPYQVISNPNSLPYMFKMRIIENGISTPLTENVQCLQADALNNKWLGTQSNGLLYVSPDGSTLLNRFNTSNSPLPENRIYTIACDRKNGIAYFGTAKGLLSYKTIAIEPLSECDKISVMPNPYIVPDGNLRIDGMVAESTVKILTLNGTLVNEFITPGGRVVMWDGKDNNGNYISSGIYIIVGYDKDGKNVCTGKVAVVRK
jgi:ligand-binding sensor domain-containing protein